MSDLTLEPIKVTTLTPISPQLSDLTTVALDGSGVFDSLMRTVKLHLTEEYDNTRITGKEYATVYLGALSAVLQQSIAYLLNNTQIDQINAQIGLVRQQIVTELSKTDDLIPEDLGFNDSTTIEGLTALEKTRTTADIAKLEADTANQNLVTASTIAVNTQQISKMGTDSEDQRNKITSDIAVNDKQIIKMTADITDQSRKVTSDIAVDGKQIDKLTADITDQDRKVTSELTVHVAQVDKLDGEVLLLGQKTISELAQTCDTLPTKASPPGNTNPWLNISSTLQGTMKKQDDLYTAQTEGFARDAEQKLAKIMVDTWSVRQAGDGALAGPAGLDDDDIASVLTIARAGLT